MKKSLKYAILAFLSSIIMLTIVVYVSLQEQVYCGHVKYKVMDFLQHKYNVENDPTLVIQWENGVTSNIHASWDHYLSSKVGDRVCYMRRISEFSPNVLTSVGIFCFVCGCFIATLFMLVWEITDLLYD